MSEYVAIRVIKVGDRKYGPGQTVPDDLGRSRLFKMLRLGDIAVAGSLAAPETASAPVAQDPGPTAPAEDETPQAATEDDTQDDADEAEFPRHTGAGWYELSDGDRVRGKQDALEAQAVLDALDE